MTKKNRRSNYPEDFKRDAVALVTEQGYSQAEAARSLGIGANLIGRWKRQFEEQSSEQGLSQDEREELKQLRREVRELRTEKDILKKASVDSMGHCNRYSDRVTKREYSDETEEANLH